MAGRGYEARRAIARVGGEIQEKAWTVGRDRREERRMQRRWGLLQSVVGAAFTLGARRLGARIWKVATGEEPPTRR